MYTSFFLRCTTKREKGLRSETLRCKRQRLGSGNVTSGLTILPLVLATCERVTNGVTDTLNMLIKRAQERPD